MSVVALSSFIVSLLSKELLTFTGYGVSKLIAIMGIHLSKIVSQIKLRTANIYISTATDKSQSLRLFFAYLPVPVRYFISKMHLSSQKAVKTNAIRRSVYDVQLWS